MKRKLLLLALCALFGMSQAKAYTTSDLTTAGWTLVSSLSDNTSNVYVLVDAGSENYAVSWNTSNADDKPVYIDLPNPFTTPGIVWTIEKRGEKFALRNIESQYYFNSSSTGWQDFMAATYETGSFTFTYSNSKYSITAVSVTSNNYVGPWNNNGAVSLTDGIEGVAANKSSAQAPGFKLYKMAKATYAKKYLQANPNLSAPVDLSFLIANPTIYQGTNKGTIPSGWTSFKHTTGNGNFTENDSGDTQLEAWHWENTLDADYYQTIASLPGGQYALTAYIHSRDAAVGDVYIYHSTNGKKTSTSPEAGNDKYADRTTEYLVIPDNESANIGMEVSGTPTWFTADNFRLKINPYISTLAVDLPAGGAMTAGQWYKVDITTSGLYMATATTLANIVYTTDGNVLKSNESSVTNTFATRLNNLSATSYYVKSSTDNNLTLTLGTYTVGSASADKSYIQEGNTVTVSYDDLNTNDGSATLTKDFSGVTFGGEAISITSTSDGFTFEVPEVTANTNYTLSIPASAIGYAEASTLNAAQNITLKTPALFDGTYFFKVENETTEKGQYLSRGVDNGTHASIDNWGLPIQVSTNSSNVTALKVCDTGKYFYQWDTANLWADRASIDEYTGFTVSLADGKYKLSSTKKSSKYLKYDDGYAKVWADGDGSKGHILEWSVETPSEHATAMAALKNVQAATAASAAYAAGSYATLNGITSISALEAELSENYSASSIVSASDITSVKEKFSDSQANTPKNVYNDGTEGSVTISTPGLYKFSIQAFYRAASYAHTQSMHTAGIDFPSVVVYFGDAETQLKSIYDEVGPNAATSHEGNADVAYNDKYYPDGMQGAQVFFQEGLYNNDVYFYVSEAGTYNYGVKYMGYAGANSQWFIYTPQSVSITGYSYANADSDDYAALATAIADAEDHTIGFEKDEYAPYNNTGIFSILETAKAIDPASDNYKYAVNASTTALNSFEWNQNATEVNAIAGGYNLDSYTNNGTYDVPNGWSNGGYNTRTVGISESLIGNNPGLAGAVNERAILVKYGTTYGESTGYTMPLKANTWYALTFKYGIWDENILITKNLSVTDPNGATINVLPGSVSKNEGDKATCANKLSTAWYDKTVWFETGETAGDYVLNVTNADGNNQRQMVFSGLMLKKAVPTVLADDQTVAPSAGEAYIEMPRKYSSSNWNTLCLPFALNSTETSAMFSSIKKLNAIEDKGSVISMSFADVDEIAAGEPYLVKAKVDNSSLPTAIRTIVEGTTNTVKSNGSHSVTFQGTLVQTGLTEDDTNAWVVKNSNLYNVNSAVNVYANRAFFTVSAAGGGVKALSFDFDNATGITETTEKTEGTESLFDLSGRRVSKAQKGLYIMNGKKVMVK